MDLSKKKGLPLIIRFATETRFQPIQVQQPAFRLTTKLFNNFNLSSSHHFICHLTQFLIWKLEKEQQFLQTQINEQINRKYDLIFSFAPSDFDQNQGLNLTIDEKCQLIDHCQYFLIVISDSYKQNLFSRCESTYAFQRQSQIIPLILNLKIKQFENRCNRILFASKSTKTKCKYW